MEESSKKNEPFVSIVIPNYNNAHFLGDAIQSVLNQTYQNFEIIVVDDGSTDNSRDVVSNFGERVRYIWQENKGLGGARNTGIMAAKGEYIGFLDADDQWIPNFLEIMVSLTQKYPDIAVFYCNARYMDKQGVDLPQSVGVRAIPPDRIYQALLRANFIIPSTILAKRSIIIDEGLFDQNCKSLHGCEDWDLWLRIAPRHKFIGTQLSLVRYRLHGQTFSSNPSHMEEAVRAVIEKQFGPEEGKPQDWPANKKRAYGGVYRYYVISSILRKNDWHLGAEYLRRAMLVDPSLAKDLDLFYDLALGSQPIGYRGISSSPNLESNARLLDKFLNDALSNNHVDSKYLYHTAFGTSYYALGIIAYNSRQFALCRKYLIKALNFRADLWQDSVVLSNLIKSMFGRSLLERVKKHGFQARN
jgi:teichuronic acid biosynthesis glycosyltransferase TuaG